MRGYLVSGAQSRANPSLMYDSGSARQQMNKGPMGLRLLVVLSIASAQRAGNQVLSPLSTD